MANKPHKSVGNERDELFALLKEASFTYRKEVIGESKLYELYVEDFLNGHYYSDHRDAAGKNRHRKNIGILRGILTKRKDLVEQFFSNILFAPNRMDELLRLFNTTKASSGLKEEPDKPRPETNLPALSLGSFLNDNQLSLIAHCANEAQLFTTPVNAGILRSLLEGTLHQPLKSANNRLVAFFSTGYVTTVSFSDVGNICWNRPVPYWVPKTAVRSNTASIPVHLVLPRAIQTVCRR